MAKIFLIHGPNLNMLAEREVSVYGHDSLATINERLQAAAVKQGHELTAFQSNAESELIDIIHTSKWQMIDYIIINPAAFTHTSIALRDALLSVKIPFIEVHISNIHQRESFRQTSYFSDIAAGVITGFGSYGYDLALRAVFFSIHSTNNSSTRE